MTWQMFQTAGATVDWDWVTVLIQARLIQEKDSKDDRVQNLPRIVHWTVKLKIVECDKTVKRKSILYAFTQVCKLLGEKCAFQHYSLNKWLNLQ